MKVALVGTRGIPPRYGGSETYVEYLSKHLAAQGDLVKVYCQKNSNDKKHNVPQGLYPPNIMRIEIPTIPSKHLDNFMRSLLSTIHASLDQEVEIVQFTNAGPCLFCFIPRLTGKKVVGAMRAIDHKREKWDALTSSLLKLGELFSIFFANITTVNSLAMKDYFRKKFHYNTIYIPNGVTSPKINLPPNQIKQWGLHKQNYLLFMARLEPEKGCHTLIEAFKKITQKAPWLKLAIAGHQGHSHSYYNELIKQKNDNIKFIGFASGELHEELFANAFAFILPSSVEGMSNSLLNAMAHGLPTIVSDIPENTSVVDFAAFNKSINDQPSLIFKLWDSDDLAEKLSTLFNDPAGTKKRGQLLKYHVNLHFKLKTMGHNTRQEYLKLIKKI